MLNLHPQTINFLYFHFLLLAVLVTSYRLASGNYQGSNKRIGTFLFMMIILLIMGLRPYNIPGVGSYFGDTTNYYRSFMQVVSGHRLLNYKDPGFDMFTQFSAVYLNAGMYFFLLSAFYIIPAWIAIKRLSPHHSFLLYLMFVTYFLFWSNGVNGIRIGIASSWFLLALTYSGKRWMQILILALAVTFHKSILLPIMAYALTLFYNNSKAYILGWFSSIVLSLLFGSFWEFFFAGFNLGDERFSKYLTTEADANVFAHIGFRWDFLMYSTIPVALGAYYIFKKNYTDKFYIQLFNTYLLANSFWILVIRASFSNRFASLSWFLIPILLLLPLLNIRIWPKQEAKIALILLLSFAFTYYMSLNLIWG